jgi:hypothetical protein
MNVFCHKNRWNGIFLIFLFNLGGLYDLVWCRSGTWTITIAVMINGVKNMLMLHCLLQKILTFIVQVQFLCMELQ